MQTSSAFTPSAAYGVYANPGCYWPLGLLEEFTLRMSAHGHSVSGNMMMGDRRYAVEQLAHAHSLSDDRLRELAMALFHHFEQQQSGVYATN